MVWDFTSATSSGLFPTSAIWTHPGILSSEYSGEFGVDCWCVRGLLDEEILRGEALIIPLIRGEFG